MIREASPGTNGTYPTDPNAHVAAPMQESQKKKTIINTDRFS